MEIFNKRIYLITKMWFASHLRRFVYDFYREMTVIACGAIIIALFSYIFSDFTNEKLGSLNPNLKLHFKAWFLTASFLLMGLTLGRWLARVNMELHEWTKMLGENPEVSRFTLYLSLSLITVIVYSLFLFAINLFFSPIANIFFSFSLSFLSLILAFALTKLMKDSRNLGTKSALLPRKSLMGEKRLPMIIHWRMAQMIKRNQLIQCTLLLATLLAASCFFLPNIGAPEILTYLWVLLAGLITALPLAWQLAEDLSWSWSEKSLGVSHGEIFWAYQLIGLLLGSITSLISCMSLFFAGDSPDFLTIIGLSSLPSLLLPSILFQVDARRPILQGLVLFLISLFMGTAIIASIYSFLAVPVLIYYLANYQNGAYYRS